MATPFQTASTLIRTKMRQEFAVPDVDLVMPNQDYEPGTKPFVSLIIEFTASNQISIGSPGSNLYRYQGIICAYVYTPINKGTKLSEQIADAVSEIFRSKAFSGILCFTPEVRTTRGAADDKGKFYGVSIFVPFQYDAIQ